MTSFHFLGQDYEQTISQFHDNVSDKPKKFQIQLFSQIRNTLINYLS